VKGELLQSKRIIIASVSGLIQKRFSRPRSPKGLHKKGKESKSKHSKTRNYGLQNYLDKGIAEADKAFAQEFEDFVNGQMHSAEQTGRETGQHALFPPYRTSLFWHLNVPQRFHTLTCVGCGEMLIESVPRTSVFLMDSLRHAFVDNSTKYPVLHT